MYVPHRSCTEGAANCVGMRYRGEQRAAEPIVPELGRNERQAKGVLVDAIRPAK